VSQGKFGADTSSHADGAAAEGIPEPFTPLMLTQGARPVLQPLLLGLTLTPAPEKVKPHKVESCCGAERL